MSAPCLCVRWAAAAGLLAAGLLATGCSAAGRPGALDKSASHLSNGASVSPVQHLAGTPSATARPASPSPARDPAAGSAGAAAQAAAAGPGQCPATGLKVTVGPANGAAGSLYYPLDFTNNSGATCTLSGYPGVEFVTAPAGIGVGAPAVRNPAFARELVRLPAGATAHASLQVQVAQSYPARLCKPVTAHWLQVYPPGSYVALFVPFTAVTCTGSIPSGSTMGIYVVRPGATGP